AQLTTAGAEITTPSPAPTTPSPPLGRVLFPAQVPPTRAVGRNATDLVYWQAGKAFPRARAPEPFARSPCPSQVSHAASHRRSGRTAPLRSQPEAVQHRIVQPPVGVARPTGRPREHLARQGAREVFAGIRPDDAGAQALCGGREPAHSLPAPQGRAGGGVSAPALNGAAERVRWLKECPGPVTSGYVPMTRSARVTSIQTVEAFKGALCEFGKDARDALCAADLAVRRAVDWLKAQQQFWQRELRKRQEDVVQAKKELTARKYQNRDGRGLGSTEQEKALKKAQDRQREAETKLANCKRWAPE